MELPLSRVQQVSSTIQLRKYGEQREWNSRFTWLGRNLGAIIAAGHMVDKGKENTALKFAQQLVMDEVEAALLGVRTGTSSENRPGSYENFMQRLGGNGGSRGALG